MIENVLCVLVSIFCFLGIFDYRFLIGALAFAIINAICLFVEMIKDMAS